MDKESNALEGLRLANDWSKWLITIETGAIAIIGSAIRVENGVLPDLAKVFGTASIVSFLIWIAAAAVLLLTLPENAQMLQPDVNIWMTHDSIAGRLLRMNTQGFAIISLSSSG